MKTLASSIQLMQLRLQELAAIVESEPEFKRWNTAGNLIDVDFIQLFPDLDPHERYASALKIADALGGEWNCDETDGSWTNTQSIARDCIGGPFRCCLHSVELKKKPAFRRIEVNPSDPSLERVESPAITV